jgi:hypothetical protein
MTVHVVRVDVFDDVYGAPFAIGGGGTASFLYVGTIDPNRWTYFEAVPVNFPATVSVQEQFVERRTDGTAVWHVTYVNRDPVQTAVVQDRSLVAPSFG